MFTGSNLAIGISLIMRDQFTGQARMAANSLRNINAQTLRAEQQQLRMQRNFNAVGAGIGLMAIRGMNSWTQFGADFNYTMTYVNQIAEKKGGVGFDKLSQKAKTLGADTMFTAKQVADGMKYLAMAGQDTEAIYNNIGAAIALAGATMERVEGKGGSGDILTNVMKGFSIEGTEKNAMRVADILTTSVTGANTNLWDLHEALKYSTATASNLGGTLEEVAASIGILGNAGIQGSMAGVALENMYRYIARAADESKSGRGGKALAALGLQPQDLMQANGQLMSMSGILKVISGQFQGLSRQDQTKKLSTVFGYNVIADMMNVRGARAGNKLLENMDDYNKFLDKLTNQSSGNALRNLQTQMGTLKGSTDQMVSSWGNFKIAFSQAIEPVVIPLLKGLTHAIKGITKVAETPLGSFLTLLGAGMIVLKTGAMAYRAVVLSLRLLHLQTGLSGSTMASSTVAGYNSMTAAAMRYNAAASGGVWGKRFARGGFGQYTGTTKGGAMYTMGKGGRSKFVPKGSAKPGWSLAGNMGKFGKMAGRLSPWGMIGGIGLNLGAEAVGSDTNLGKGMNIVGDTIGWAGTGAMIGSMAGPLGTGIGAVVGGVGGLLYSLYNNLSDVADEVEKAKPDTASKPEFNAQRWREQVAKLRGMNVGDMIYGAGYSEDLNGMWATDRVGASSWLSQGGTSYNGRENRIIINIDGKKTLDKTVEDRDYETLVNLGI